MAQSLLMKLKNGGQSLLMWWSGDCLVCLWIIYCFLVIAAPEERPPEIFLLLFGIYLRPHRQQMGPYTDDPLDSTAMEPYFWNIPAKDVVAGPDSSQTEVRICPYRCFAMPVFMRFARPMWNWCGPRVPWYFLGLAHNNHFPWLEFNCFAFLFWATFVLTDPYRAARQPIGNCFIQLMQSFLMTLNLDS